MKFEDALKHSLKMLSSPEFLKDIEGEDATMVKHYGIIKEINKNGYLTIGSQAGHKSSGLTWDTKKPFVTEERAYMEGFMQEDKAAKFIEKLMTTTDKNAIVIAHVPGDITRKFDIPLTVDKVKGEKLQVRTHMATVASDEYMDYFRKNAHLNKTDKAVFIFCWDSTWNRNASSKHGLFTDILDTLKSI